MCTERYINPFTDFGFKRLFGSDSSKPFIISFLNSLLGDKEKIVDVQYLKTEKLGITPSYRSAIFDIYCLTDTGAHIIVEMQNMFQRFFMDRSIYYSTFPMQEVAQRGDWDFNLPKIYTVAFLNFVMDEFGYDNHFRHVIQLADVETGKVFYDKLTYIYIEMPKFNKELDELETDFDRWLYSIKNINTLDAYPADLNEDVYERFFQEAEIQAFTKEERVAYEQSLKEMRDYNNVLKTAKEDAEAQGVAKGLAKGLAQGLAQGLAKGMEEGLAKGMEEGLAKGMEEGIAEGMEKGLAKGMEEGLAKGMEEGLAEGRNQERLDIAKKMKAAGLPTDEITRITGMAAEEIEKL